MMVNELRSLLQEAVAHPPEDPADLWDVVRDGQRIRRRRRAVTVGVVGLAAATVVAGAVWAGGLPGGGDVGPAEGPTEGTSLGEAVPAQAGRDYDVVGAYEGPGVLAGTTTDGLGLVWQETDGGEGYAVRVGLFDPAGGATTWLPQPEAVLSQPLALEEDRLVFLVEVDRVGPRVGVFDRATQSWSTATWRGLRGAFHGAALGPEGRVWFDEGGRLVSGSLTDPGDLRDEGLAVGGFDIDGTTLAAVGSGPSAGELVVSDLASRETRSYPLTAGDERCGDPEVDLSGDLVALSWNCGTSGNLADPEPSLNRVLVVTTSGEEVADVGALPGNLRLDGRVVGEDVLLTSMTPRTTYDPEVCDFPFDGLPTRYLTAWSERTDELARERGAADGWEYCQVSHEVYRELVLPHLDEARVPTEGYGYYVVDGDSGELLQLTDRTPPRPGWGLSEDGRAPVGSRLLELR